jgi:hypothetical protein
MGKSKNHSALHKYKWGGDVLVLKDVCFECGSSDDIHYHHVVPETKGGTKTIPLCIVCHGKVHNRDFMKIKELQKIGIEKAKANGKYLGRRPETMESEEKFISKPKRLKLNNPINNKKANIVKYKIENIDQLKKIKELQTNIELIRINKRSKISLIQLFKNLGGKW